jgi:DNA sulfur modification protein DndE
MKAPIEHIHLSQVAKDQLVKLKRITGIDHWNTLCRWSLLYSLADSSEPSAFKIPSDSNLEMSWRTFTGAYGPIILASIRQRYQERKNRSLDIGTYFRMHLHRGISALANRKGLSSIHDLCSLATKNR